MSETDSERVAAKPPELRGVLPAGTRLRNYELISVLGQGGFGITYHARDTTLGRDVAIKEYLPTALALRENDMTVLPRSTALSGEFTWGRERFLEEARTLALLEQVPAVVRVHDFLEANGTAYMVMALARGETLDQRLRRGGAMSAAEVERMLGPLLDGLAKVHAAGFLHRDIKPANILIDDAGLPTLIDFGASRAAMAGRTTAMTAVFTPGYAAAEQFTSGKQGPWTDIYSLAATLYHAIVGRVPPSAFERMLDDAYEPLGALLPPEFAPGLLAAIDAGLAVRAGDRPQTIDAWRVLLGQSAAEAAEATTRLVRLADMSATVAGSSLAAAKPARAGRRRRSGVLAFSAVAVLVLAGGGAYLATRPPAIDPIAAAEAQKARDELAASEAARRKAEADMAKLRDEAAAREKAAADAEERRQIEAETRRKIEAEQAEARQKTEAEAAARHQAEEEARQRADAEAAARRKAEETDKKAAEAIEAALRLTTLDRQHIQVALTAAGFGTNGTDGVLGPRSREMIAAWQKVRNHPQSGFLTATQSQALLKEAAPAITKFDEEQKKLEEEKARAATTPPGTPPAPTPAPPVPTAAAPAPAPSLSDNPADGQWQGIYDCQSGGGLPPFTIQYMVTLVNGRGVWTPSGQGITKSIALRVNGGSARFTRTILTKDGMLFEFAIDGKISGNTITASGIEQARGDYRGQSRPCSSIMGRAGVPR